jgi:nitroimidazol reductase NimA-like FMN-containing flavoprotein (pyridoxamine 5'-phosphate oxidase superfamily)
MSRKEVWSFLESQRRVYLGFAMENGYPHVTPIWFVIIGERVYMRAQDYKVKVGLAAKGKACVVIDDGDRYRELRGAVMWGRSRIVTDEKLMAGVTKLFEAKYSERQWKAAEMPKAWVRERTKERRAFIEFVPEKVDSWDNSKI